MSVVVISPKHLWHFDTVLYHLRQKCQTQPNLPWPRKKIEKWNRKIHSCKTRRVLNVWKDKMMFYCFTFFKFFIIKSCSSYVIYRRWLRSEQAWLQRKRNIFVSCNKRKRPFKYFAIYFRPFFLHPH